MRPTSGVPALTSPCRSGSGIEHHPCASGDRRANASEVDALLSSASLFDLTQREAKRIVAEVADATRGWLELSRRNGIPQQEIARFQPTLEATIAVVTAAAA